MPTKSLISIVDDDEDFRRSLTDLMQAMGFTVEAFSSAAELPNPACVPSAWEPPLSPNKVAVVAAGMALQVILVLGLGLPKRTRRLYFSYHLARPAS